MLSRNSDTFFLSSMQQGKMFLFIGIIMAGTQGGFVRRIKSGKESFYAFLVCSLLSSFNWTRKGPKRESNIWRAILSCQGICMMVPSFVLIGSAHQVWQLYFGLFLYSLSSGIVVPCLTTLVSSFGPKEHKGVTLGIFRSIGSLARAFGPLAASAGNECPFFLSDGLHDSEHKTLRRSMFVLSQECVPHVTVIA